MDENAIDTRLKQYALAAQRHPARSKERQQALTDLICELQQPGLLCRPFKGFFPGLYPEIYAEAQHLLFCHVCLEIERYNPEKKVLQWVNFLLRKRFFVQACRAIYPNASRGGKCFTIKSLEDLDSLVPETSISLSERILECLAEDPEGVFRATYTQKFEANFQYIAQQVAAGYKWQELSKELEIGVSSLSSFYYRYLKKFSPIFRRYITSYTNLL